MNELRAHLLGLADYTAWADALVAGALEPLPEGDTRRRALHLLDHVTRAEAVWLERVRGETPRTPVWGDSAAPATPAAVLERSAAALGGWRAALTETDDLRTPVRYANSRGARFETALADVWLHVVNHGSHHRGQVVAALRAAGVAPPVTDQIAWLRAGRPGAGEV